MSRGNHTVLLWLGLAAGVVLALAGIFGVNVPGGGPAGGASSVAATVNSTVISQSVRARAVEAVERDRGSRVSAQERSRLLERMIEEELLVQRGVEMGLLESDTTVRQTLTAAMIRHLLAETASQDVDEKTLRRFFEAHAERFTPAARLHVRRFVVADPVAAERAAEALASGEAFAVVAARMGEANAVSPPDDIVPVAKLKDYLGGDLADVAANLEPGELAGPIETASGWHFVLLVARSGSEAVTFEAVRDEVLHAYRIDRDDRALRDYLSWLKSRAEIERQP